MKNIKLIIVILFLAALMFSGCDASDAAEQVISEDEAIEMIQGFWQLTGYTGELDESIKLEGDAVYFDDDEMDVYFEFRLYNEAINFELSDGDTLSYYEDGEKVEMDITFRVSDGYKLMILKGDEGTAKFEKTSYDAYMLYQGIAEERMSGYMHSIELSDSLSDGELTDYLADTYWTEEYYIHADGTIEEMNPFTMVLYTDDMWGIMQYTDEILYIDWVIDEGRLYTTYDNGETFYFDIDYVFDSETGYAYFYIYDMEEGYEGNAWVLWDLVDMN